MNLDPRIGKLNSGKFYCFPNGNGKPELIGTLDEVEAALGLRAAVDPVSLAKVASRSSIWTVTLRFQFPAWDEVDGLEYRDIRASSKANANAIARRMSGNDGHLGSGKGRVTFTATVTNEGIGTCLTLNA